MYMCIHSNWAKLPPKTTLCMYIHMEYIHANALRSTELEQAKRLVVWMHIYARYGVQSIKTILTCDRSTCFCRGSVALKRNAFPVPSKAHFAPSYHIELADRILSWARSEEPAPLFHSLDSWGRWDLFSGGMKVARSPQRAWSIELLRVATGNYGGARSDWRQVQSLMYSM